MKRLRWTERNMNVPHCVLFIPIKRVKSEWNFQISFSSSWWTEQKVWGTITVPRSLLTWVQVEKKDKFWAGQGIDSCQVPKKNRSGFFLYQWQFWPGTDLSQWSWPLLDPLHWAKNKQLGCFPINIFGLKNWRRELVNSDLANSLQGKGRCTFRLSPLINK